MAERAEVAAVHKIAGFKRVLENDPQLKQQIDDASKAFKEGEQQAAKAEQTFETMEKGALVELAALSKLLA